MKGYNMLSPEDIALSVENINSLSDIRTGISFTYSFDFGNRVMDDTM